MAELGGLFGVFNGYARVIDPATHTYKCSEPLVVVLEKIFPIVAALSRPGQRMRATKATFLAGLRPNKNGGSRLSQFGCHPLYDHRVVDRIFDMLYRGARPGIDATALSSHFLLCSLHDEARYDHYSFQDDRIGAIDYRTLLERTVGRMAGTLGEMDLAAWIRMHDMCFSSSTLHYWGLLAVMRYGFSLDLTGSPTEAKLKIVTEGLQRHKIKIQQFLDAECSKIRDSAFLLDVEHKQKLRALQPVRLYAAVVKEEERKVNYHHHASDEKRMGATTVKKQTWSEVLTARKRNGRKK